MVDGLVRSELCVTCVVLQVQSSCCLSEDFSACCVESFMETPSVQKNTSPHTLTMRSTRYLAVERSCLRTTKYVANLSVSGRVS